MCHRRTIGPLFLGCMVCLSGWNAPSWSQDSARSNTATVNSNMEALVEQTMKVIGQIRLSEKNYYKKDALQIPFDEAKTMIELRMEYTNNLHAHLDMRKHESEVLIQTWNADLAKLEKEAKQHSGSMIYSLETIELLSRNCLSERLRLQWESAAEESKLESEKKATAVGLKAEKMRLQSAKLALEGMELKLQEAARRLEEVKVLHAKGLVGASELNEAESVVKESQNQFLISKQNHDIAELDSDRQQTRLLEGAALNRESIQQRRKLCDQQLEQFANQRKFAESFAAIQSKIAQEENTISRLRQLSLQNESDRSTCQILLAMLEKASSK